jgi:MFS family permease
MGFGSALFGALTGSVVLVGASLMVPALLVVRGLMGLCSAPIYPACGRVVSRWIPFPQRALANGMVTCAAPVGIACTFVGFGNLMDWVDWPWAFAITGGITAVLALLWTVHATDYPAQHQWVNRGELRLIEQDEPMWSATKIAAAGAGELWGSASFPATADDTHVGRPQQVTVRGRFAALFHPIVSLFRREPRPTPSPPEPVVASPAPAAISTAGSSWTILLRNRSLVFLTISYGAVNYFEYLFTFWMHHYFDEVLNVGKDRSRYYAGIVNLAQAGGMVLGGWLSDRLQRRFGYRRGRAIVPVAGLLGSAIFLAIGLQATQPGWIVGWFALANVAVGMCEGPFWATAIELGGSRGGTSAGMCNTGGNAGGLVAPIITPVVSGAFGWFWGIGLGSVVCVAGAALWWWIDPGERCEETTISEAASDGRPSPR